MLDALDDLAAAIERSDDALDGCDDEVLAAAMERLAELRITLDALWLRAVGIAGQRALHRRHGARDTAAWVAGLAGERAGAARRDVELAAQLAATPLVAEAMTAGSVSKAKAAELVRAGALPEDAQLALVELAATAAVAEVAAAVEQARLADGVSSAPVTPTLTITRKSDHATVEGTVDLVDAELLDVALSTAVEALGLPSDMPYPQRRAKALATIARFFLEHQTDVPSGRLGRPHIVALVPLETLEARTGGSALLASGAVITGDQARRLAEDANISRVITSGRSEPLDVGRSTRSVPPAIAKSVIARDRHCRYRGCTAPPWACDIHHRVPWARGGPTALINLGLLCWHHHEHVHRHGPDRLTLTSDGRWTLDAELEAVAA